MPDQDEITVTTEDDPTPLVLAIRTDLARRLADPEFAALTRELRGTVSIRASATPEAATATIGDGGVGLTHGSSAEAQVVATVDGAGRRAEISAPAAEPEDPGLVAWAEALLAPATPWTEAAERFWSALEPLPGAPAALLVVNLESGDRRRFGSDGRVYEIHGTADDLVALLEGRTSLIEEAFERRIFIRGSFPEISVLSAAAFDVRMGAGDDG